MDKEYTPTDDKTVRQIAAYIERTAIPKKTANRYDITLVECARLGHIYHTSQAGAGDVLDAIYWAFLYGRAKGYRAGRLAAATPRKKAVPA